MGHYLAEMENDGVPRAFKAGTSSAPARPEKYSIIKCVCTKKEIEKLFGVTLTWPQVDAYLDAMEARRPAVQEMCAEHAKQRRVIYAAALAAVLGSDMPADPSPALSREGAAK